MQRYVIIDTANGNSIINSVEYDQAPTNPPPGFGAGTVAIQNDIADQTWTYDGTTFHAPVIVAPVIVPISITDRQFFQQLAVQSIITEADALAANAAVIPPALLTLIDAMPTDQQFSAKMIVSGATTFYRNDPLTISIGAAYGMSSAQIDAFFTAASKL